MFDIRQFAMNLIGRKNTPNTPLQENMLSVIMNGDNQKGEELARNLCRNMGVSEAEAVERAKTFFNIR